MSYNVYRRTNKQTVPVNAESDKLKTELKEFMDELGFISSAMKSGIKPNLTITEPSIPGSWTRQSETPGISIKVPLDLDSISWNMNRSDDLAKLIIRNLTSAGIERKRHVTMIGRYLTGAYLSRLPLFIAGSAAERIADVLSISVSGKHPIILHISNKLADISELVSAIRAADAKVIVIRSSSEFIDDKLFLTLKTEAPEKMLIFSVTLTNSLSILPLSVFSYAGVIDSELCWMYLQDARLEGGNFDDNGTIQVISTTYESLFTFMKPFAEFSGLDNGYLMTRAGMLAKLEHKEIINPEKDFYIHIFPLLHELYVINKAANKTKEFMNFLSQFPDKRPYNTIKSLLEVRF